MNATVRSRREFRVATDELAARAPFQGRDYLDYHRERMWQTYRVANRIARSAGRPARVLSVGAGSAYVEATLARRDGAEVVVVDFPDAVAAAQHYYDSVAIEAVAHDLSSDSDLAAAVGSDFDIVMSCEIVEHLPIAPVDHFRDLAPLVARGGAFLVTTPNAGSVRRVIKTLLHVPTLPDATMTFGPVDIEHEGVHRREYMFREIASALDGVDFRVTAKRYCLNGFSRRVDQLAAPIELACPWFRDALVVVARRKNATA